MQVIFSFYEEVEVMNDTLLFFAMKYDGNFREIFHAIEMKEPIDQQILKKYKKQVRHKYVTKQNQLLPSQKSLFEGLEESYQWYLDHPDEVVKKNYIEFIDQELI